MHLPLSTSQFCVVIIAGSWTTARLSRWKGRLAQECKAEVVATGRKGCLVDATKQSAGVSFWFMSVRSNATNVRGMRLARCRNRIIVSRLSCYAFSRFRPLMRLSHMPVLLVSCGNNKFKRRKRFCRVVTRVERTPPEKFSPPWKNVLDSLKNWPPSVNSSPLVSQAGYMLGVVPRLWMDMAPLPSLHRRFPNPAVGQVLPAARTDSRFRKLVTGIFICQRGEPS